MHFKDKNRRIPKEPKEQEGNWKEGQRRIPRGNT